MHSRYVYVFDHLKLNSLLGSSNILKSVSKYYLVDELQRIYGQQFLSMLTVTATYS